MRYLLAQQVQEPEQHLPGKMPAKPVHTVEQERSHCANYQIRLQDQHALGAIKQTSITACLPRWRYFLPFRAPLLPIETISGLEGAVDRVGGADGGTTAKLN